MKKNRYIIIDGIDGAGKTSIVAQVVKGLKAYHVWEPGSQQALRQLAIGEDNPDAQLLLYVADRIIVHENIKRYLEESDVVSDRGFPSTYVYQNPEKASLVHNIFSDCFVIPDRIYLIDIPYETFMDRRYISLNNMDIFAKDNFERIRQRYLSLSFPNTSILDGTKPISDTVDIILDDLSL